MIKNKKSGEWHLESVGGDFKIFQNLSINYKIEENDKLKKVILIKEQNEKDLSAKLEGLPFVQTKLKTLEAILKRKKF